VSAVFWNIIIGLVTSVLSGGAVWVWQHARVVRSNGRKAAFFGIRPGEVCLIVMNNKWNAHGSTAHSDVHALIEAATLARELGAQITLKSCNDIQEGNGSRTEFCIGGPLGGSNPRTGEYLASYLPGVALLPADSRRDPLAITVGDQVFPYDPGNEAHALIAKFVPRTARRPVILICGQEAIANRAAIHLLARDYRELMKTFGATRRFGIIVRVSSLGVFGHEAVEFVSDVTARAFVPPAP
jgi:hypothetical protein